MSLARVTVALSLTAWLIPPGAVRAETLPLRLHDVPEGLANSRVTAILQARPIDDPAERDGVSALPDRRSGRQSSPA